MKTQLLTKFIRQSAPLVAMALLLGLIPAAWAQLPRNRGTLYTNGCYYILKANPVIPAGQPGYLVLERQGCRVFGRDGRIYYRDDRTQTWQDELSGAEYAFTSRGWVVLAEYPAQQRQTKRGDSDGLNNQGFLDPESLKMYNQARDAIDKGNAAGMGLCGGNSSDFQKCLDKKAEIQRETTADANKVYTERQDFNKAMDKGYTQRQDFNKAMDRRAEANKEWNKKR